MTLREELDALLGRAGFTERQQRALRRRFGWDGSAPATLAAAARSTGYTRERVRQLEVRLRSLRPPPAVAAALADLEAAAPAHVDDVDVGLHPAALLETAALFGVETDVTATRGVLLRDGDRAAAAETRAVVRALVERDGAARPADVADHLRLDEQHVRRLLRADRTVEWPADDWVVVPGRCPVERTLAKLLPVVGSLSLDDLETPLPFAVLAAVCARVPWAAVVGARVFAVQPRPERLTPIERAIVDAFRTSGPVLTTRRLLEAGEDRGIRRGSIAVTLSRSPLFQRVGRGRHALVGYRGDVVELRQRPADPAHGLADAMLVLDEREANVALAVDAEAAAGADRDVRLAQEA